MTLNYGDRIIEMETGARQAVNYMRDLPQRSEMRGLGQEVASTQMALQSIDDRIEKTMQQVNSELKQMKEAMEMTTQQFNVEINSMKETLSTWSDQKNFKEGVLASAAEHMNTQLTQLRHEVRQEFDQLWHRCEVLA